MKIKKRSLWVGLLNVFWLAGAIAMAVGFVNGEPGTIVTGALLCVVFQGVIVEAKIEKLRKETRG